MATKKAAEKTEEVDTGDSPLIDMNNRQVKRMIKSAKDVGFVTYDALNAVLPPEEFTSEQIEDIMSMLSEMGITVVENDGTDENDDDAAAANDDNEAEADFAVDSTQENFERLSAIVNQIAALERSNTTTLT